MTAEISWLPPGADPLDGYEALLAGHETELQSRAAELFEMVELGCDWKLTVAWFELDAAVRSLRGVQHWLWRYRQEQA